jgi:hypothetical protein
MSELQLKKIVTMMPDPIPTAAEVPCRHHLRHRRGCRWHRRARHGAWYHHPAGWLVSPRANLPSVYLTWLWTIGQSLFLIGKFNIMNHHQMGHICQYSIAMLGYQRVTMRHHLVRSVFPSRSSQW